LRGKGLCVGNSKGEIEKQRDGGKIEGGGRKETRPDWRPSQTKKGQTGILHREGTDHEGTASYAGSYFTPRKTHIKSEEELSGEGKNEAGHRAQGQRGRGGKSRGTEEETAR